MFWYLTLLKFSFLLRNLNASSFVSLVTFFFISVYFILSCRFSVPKKVLHIHINTYHLEHPSWREECEGWWTGQPPSNIYNTPLLQKDLWGVAGLLRFHLTSALTICLFHNEGIVRFRGSWIFQEVVRLPPDFGSWVALELKEALSQSWNGKEDVIAKKLFSAIRVEIDWIFLSLARLKYNWIYPAKDIISQLGM